MILINGLTAQTLAINDRGLHYGDGCFTTARIAQGQVALLEQHLARLRHDVARLNITFNDWPLLEQEMCQLAAHETQAVLKVIITRGSGGRGYSPQGCQQPTRILSTSAYPNHYATWQQQGIRLATSPVRLGHNPYLAGIKHLNRLEQVLIRQHLEPSAQEALVLDQHGNMVECCAANLFWREAEKIYTPKLDGCGVAGIMRQQIIERLATLGYGCHQVSRPPAALEHADELFICNALMPVVPVVALDHRSYRLGEVFVKLLTLGLTAD